MKRTFFALFVGLALAACGSAVNTETSEAEPTEHHASAGAEQGALVPIGEARIGDRSTCPVSGEEFTVTASSPTVEHEGRTYYFCCPHCAERFQANPDQFLQQHGAHAEHGAES